MKNYKEMANEVLFRIKKEKIKQKKCLITSLCIIFILPVFTFLLINQNISDKVLENYMIITNYKTNLEQSYIVPKNGEYYCFIEVNEARKKYIDKNVSYLLKIELFKEKNGEYVDIKKEEYMQELKRLSEEGYKFYKVYYWLYNDSKTEKIYYPTIMVKLTEEQLQNFKSNDNYGYAFRFITNEDYSPIEFYETNVISNFDTYYE